MNMACVRRMGIALALFGVAGQLLAWSGHETVEHGLRILIPEIADVAEPHSPTNVMVTLENQGGEAKRGEIELRDLVDAWEAVGAAKIRFELGPGESRDFSFKIVSGSPVYAALYPVHAYATFREGGGKRTVHAVRIFRVTATCAKTVFGGKGGMCVICHGKKTGKAEEQVELPLLTLVPDGALALWRENEVRVGWRYYDQPIVWKPVGWKGSDPVCRGNMTTHTVVRGDARACINMHPPWRPGGGTIWCDFRVQLPARGPVKLRFSNAIRDHAKTEPGSDGVLFRVWAFEGGTVPDRPVFARFTDSKVWEDGEVDLAPWLGKTITLRLESHPGPNHDTQCDSSYWGEPLLAAGSSLTQSVQGGGTLPPDLVVQAQAVASGRVEADNRETFRLEGAAGGPFGVVVKPGPMGLLDGWFVFASADSATAFRGLDVELLYESVGRPPARHIFRKVIAKISRRGVRYVHRVGDKKIEISLRAESAGLRVSVASDERITRLGPNAWSSVADRVFLGHGYVIEKPQAFRMGFGGHSLAASHVAFEFGKLAVLEASDTPPSHFEVDPKRRIHGLYTREDSTLTFVPAIGAMNAALAYRPLYDKEPAAGVERLSGRMCFDIWGGSFGQIRDRMRQAVRRGLVDSFLTVHNWQRWGYDYRLPDIWPPNSKRGTVEELRELGGICRDQDIPWGLHDNYIDFYPDAEEYSYKHIYFHKNGDPHKAWHNRGREAYSYKWRPDKILPFVKRNLRAIKKEVAPTHTFLDVFTSTGCTDWWDWDGKHHSGVETRKYWGETFAWMRDYLGDDAPTTSEAGHDQLIGYLDGADCQWLTLDSESRKFVIQLQCGDWERVPWYDAVNHANFILHGVGYSSRYQAGRSRAVHGISSDDYISMEVLSGHALMVDAGCWGRAATRKYYFLQDLARRLALRNVASFEFVDGDIHRQRVAWDEGTEVFVNRGKAEWTVKGRTLPQYGFLARNGEKYASVEKKDGKYAESSRGESGWFCNARTESPEWATRVLARPFVEAFDPQENGVFRYDFMWDVSGEPAANWRVFVHFINKKDENTEKIAFQDDHEPSVAVKDWRPGEVRTPRTVEIPDGAEGTYQMMAGLYSRERGRASLNGLDGGKSRILLGTIRIQRRQGKVASVTFTPPVDSGSAPEVPPVNPPGTVVDFGFAKTDGAFRIEAVENGLRVTPLPKSRDFSLTLRLPALTGGRAVTIRSVTMIPEDQSAESAESKFVQRGGELMFRHVPSAFAYDIRW